MCHVSHSMKKIDNISKIRKYLEQYKLNALLKNYPLDLYHFQAHEILNEKLNPRNFLLFLVSGSTSISTIRIDGSVSQISKTDPLVCFGDIEFTQNSTKQYLIETLTPCYMLSIDLSTTRDQIKKDPDLLFFLLQSVSEKTAFIANSKFETTDIRSKVLYYLEYEAKDNMICGVEQCANHINASRRQLQRILKELVDEGIIVKVKKGIYVKQSCI